MKAENILIAPLNWGLGHASRCVPLINKFIHQGHNVIVAADGESLEFLKTEFPKLTCIQLKQQSISYTKGKAFILWLALQMPRFAFGILQEHFRVLKIVKQHNINRIISDNRYGLFTSISKNIIITHQIFIQVPKGIKFLSPLIHRYTKYLISKFDECWVPDYESGNKNLSGKLSHGNKVPKNVSYIGPLSRFKRLNPKPIDNKEKAHFVVLISGPEPQRSVFEDEMTLRFKNSDKNVLMLCGQPKAKNTMHAQLVWKKPGIIKINHLPTPQLNNYLLHAEKIITRSGYSSIMDLHALNKNAELHPTLGQTEQEYLFEWLQGGSKISF